MFVDVPNILLILPSIDNNSYDLITSEFVGRFNSSSSILLDKLYWGNISFRNNANLFPDKLHNLQQRIVKLAIFNYKPYTIWENVVSIIIIVANSKSMYLYAAARKIGAWSCSLG